MNYDSQRGISLYYAVLIMSISLAVALGLNTIAIKSFRTTQEVKKSPPALHGADTGIERALYDISTNNADIGSTTKGTLDLGEKGTVRYRYEIISTTSAKCTGASIYCVRSSGRYQGSKRFIKVAR